MRAWAACGNMPQFLFFFNRLFPLFLKAQDVSKDIFCGKCVTDINN